MVCDIRQKVSGFTALIEMYLDNSLVATASTNNNFIFGGTWNYFALDKLKYSLVWSNHVWWSNRKKKVKDRRYIKFDILNANNEVIGSVYQKTTDGNIFKRYEYFEMDLYGTKYQLYIISLGKEDKYPIYKGDVQVALIEKGNVVYNNLDEYQIFAKEYHTIEIANLFCVYVDLMCFGSLGEVVTKGVSKSYAITTLKDLNSKYDPLFKDSVMC